MGFFFILLHCLLGVKLAEMQNSQKSCNVRKGRQELNFGGRDNFTITSRSKTSSKADSA